MSVRVRVRTISLFVCALLLTGWRVHAQSSEQPAEPAAAPSRPPLLVPLYGSFVVVEALDVDSTLGALRNHAGSEGNPMMRGIVQSPPAFVAVKLGAAAGIIALSERIRKRHPTLAVVTMIALNGAYTAVVVNNYAIAHR